METVVVEAETETQRLRKDALSIAVVDTKQLQSTSADVKDVLSRESGVAVRSTGAVGARLQVNLNGLQGRSIRFFKDGIPLDYLGMGFHPGIIPIHMLDRIEIYKGVMPVYLGADALGGGINFVTRKNQRDYLDVSYMFGSWNTHLATVNTRKNIGKNFYVHFNGFHNYSDNNYRVRVDYQEYDDFTIKKRDVNLFHNAYGSSFGEMEFGIVDQSWVDLLSLSLVYTKTDKDIQHGLIMGYTAFGKASEHERAFTPSLRYQKNGVLNLFDVDAFASVSLQEWGLKDDSSNIYEWDGSVGIVKIGPSGELGSVKSNRTLNNVNIINRLNLEIPLSKAHKIVANSVHKRFLSEGSDPLYLSLSGIDPSRDKRDMFRLVSALGYQFDWDFLHIELALKNYLYEITQYGSGAVVINFTTFGQNIRQTGDHNGYSLVGKVDIAKNLMLKASYEHTLRIPDPEEILGDNQTVIANAALRPERSHNANLGLRFEKSFAQSRRVTAHLNGFYRDTRDYIFIYYDFLSSQFRNDTDVRSLGGEGGLEIAPVNFFVIGGNVTYQDIRKNSYNEDAEKELLELRYPNIPWLFWNVQSRLIFRELLSAGDELQIYGYLHYVHSFERFYGQGLSETRAKIPSQFSVATDRAGGV